MQLYTDVERIDHELQALGIPKDSSYIDPWVINKFDSMHYEGNETITKSIDALQITSSSKLLDIGSGFGGPARVLALMTKCNVVAMELQNDIHEKALSLTTRCKLEDTVQHIQGDILKFDKNSPGFYPGGGFDGIVSWLTFLHIQDKQSLFHKCFELLRSNDDVGGMKGGKLYCDDFFMKQTFTDQQVTSLEKNVFCSDLPTREEYVRTLKDCGFVNIVFEDRTEAWRMFTKNRLEKFISNRDRFVKIHSVATYDNLFLFYNAMVELFSSGNLGGARIIAGKKLNP